MMKRTKILLALLCTALVGRAQDGDYRPMLVEGRVWKVIIDTKRLAFDPVVNEFVLKDTTIIEEYKYSSGYPAREDCTGRKVYWTASNEEHIEFDFGLNEGDIFVSACGNNYTVESIDSIEVNGQVYRRFFFRGLNHSIYCWVEGIGSSTYGPNNFLCTSQSYAISCRTEQVLDDGVCVFEYKDFFSPAVSAGITTTTLSPSATDALFDLHGRRLAAPPAKGVYIQGGRKRVAP